MIWTSTWKGSCRIGEISPRKPRLASIDQFWIWIYAVCDHHVCPCHVWARKDVCISRFDHHTQMHGRIKRGTIPLLRKYSALHRKTWSNYCQIDPNSLQGRVIADVLNSIKDVQPVVQNINGRCWVNIWTKVTATSICKLMNTMPYSFLFSTPL